MDKNAQEPGTPPSDAKGATRPPMSAREAIEAKTGKDAPSIVDNGDVRPLVFYPSKQLKSESDPIPSEMFGSDELRKLTADLVVTMYMCGGVGLSAIQVGVPYRLFVCDIHANIRGRPSQLRVFCNPSISEAEGSENVLLPEGCLSFPGAKVQVSRPSRVRVSAHTHLGDAVDLVADGWLARVIQHEADHLDGKLMSDRVSTLKRREVLRQTNKTLKIAKEGGRNSNRRRRRR